MSRDELRNGLTNREWPSDDLEDVVTELAAEGAILSADEGRFTIQGYGQAAPTV
jgi:hypothetical protein